MATLNRQIESILDTTSGKEVDVIVQMEAEKSRPKALRQVAGQALQRRRLSLTPRDLLPKNFRQKRPTAQARRQTASARSLLSSRATQETLALAAIQKIGRNPLAALMANSIVKDALGSMLDQNADEPQHFWTSRSMPLRIDRDKLLQLSQDVNNIKAIHLNRTLRLPNVVETQALSLEAEELRASAWGIEKIKALSVWGSYGARGKGIKVGVLDTGVDANHPDLDGKVSDWAEFDTMGRKVPGSKPHDTDEHGTHCAGTIAGGNESGRYIGVAPEANIAAALVLDGEKGGTDAQVLAGIDWAVEQGVDVISMSLGGLIMDAETPPTYTSAILTCIEAGIPVVAAIGNEGGQTSGSPGNDLFALSIGATDHRDRVAGFSGGRTQIISESEFLDSDYLPLPYLKPDLVAPGVAIYSSVPKDEWKSFNGTSMATPHVAGAIALLLSATSIKAKEEGTARSYLIQDLITGAVEDLGEAGQDQRFGFGRLDVLRAVDIARHKGYD